MNRFPLLNGCVAACAAAALSAATASAEAAEPVWSIRQIPLERVSVVAHRGAGFLAPENTMGALELSWSMGCIPEVDVRTTKDGRVMMFHDSNFARILPNASEEMKKKRLEDLTYDEAKKLDIGAFRGPEHAGQRIVSLADICAALKKDPKRRVYLDVKNVDFSQMARETEGVHEQVILATGSEEDCAKWKKVAPRSDTFLWVGTWDDKDDTNVEKRFEKLHFHVIGQPAYVVVALDDVSSAVSALDNIGIYGALKEPVRSSEIVSLIAKKRSTNSQSAIVLYRAFVCTILGTRSASSSEYRGMPHTSRNVSQRASRCSISLNGEG